MKHLEKRQRNNTKTEQTVKWAYSPLVPSTKYY